MSRGESAARRLVRRLRRHGRWLVVFAAVAAHRLWTAPPGCARDARTIAVLDWNLENFPGDHDIAAMRRIVTRADPTIFAVQEVLDTDALAELWPGATWSISTRGGVRGQRLGVGTRDATVGDIVEHGAFEHGGRVRPAVSVVVERDGVRFALVVVHLKAKIDGAVIRRLQWLALIDLVARLRVEDGGRNIVVLGDFNTSGDGEMSSDDERAQLEASLAPLGLRAVPTTPACTAYWDGARRDAWLEPSTLDLVFVAGFDDAEVTARSLGACAAHSCAAIRSTDDHPDPALHATSDHCPVLVEITRGGAH